MSGFKKTASELSIAFFLALLLILIGPQPASARTEAIHAVSDTYVDEANPNSNYGHDLYLRVRSEENSNQRIYLGFNLARIPNNAQISSATLNLYHYYGDGTAAYRVYRVAERINEANLTWNNQPDPLTDWYAELTIVGTERDQWRSWDVTPTIDSTALTNDYVSYLIRCKDENSATVQRCTFFSKDYSPRYVYLQIAYNMPPTLTGGEVLPESDVWGSTFKFRVIYADADGDEAAFVNVFIDGSPHPMTRVDHYPNWTSGVRYSYSWSTGPADLGSHRYFFRTSDGAVETSSPTFEGPTVTKKPSSISLYAPSPIRVDLESPITISGTKSPPGKKVTLRFTRPNQTTFTHEVSADGSFSHVLGGWIPEDVGMWKVTASWAGDELYEGTSSSERVFWVTKIRSTIAAGLSVSGTHITKLDNLVRANKSVTISGRVTVREEKPPPESATLKLLFELPGKKAWTDQITSRSDGSFSYTFVPEKIAKLAEVQAEGDWRVRAEWGGTEWFNKAESSTHSFMVMPALFVETHGAILATAGVALLVALFYAWKGAMRISKVPPPPPPKPTEELEFEIPERKGTREEPGGIGPEGKG